MTGSPMKIAILTSGILPVPAVHGGAVENLVDFYSDITTNNYTLYETISFSNIHYTMLILLHSRLNRRLSYATK